jgi:hypothetical protein
MRDPWHMQEGDGSRDKVKPKARPIKPQRSRPRCPEGQMYNRVRLISAAKAHRLRCCKLGPSVCPPALPAAPLRGRAVICPEDLAW